MGAILIQASSPPVVTEVQDFATALFDARGDFVAMGSNVIPHVAPMQFAVRAIMEECAENPGIGDGAMWPHPGVRRRSKILALKPQERKKIWGDPIDPPVAVSERFGNMSGLRTVI
jgi:hypothetical protein